ncbi:unnamed protein product [Lepeophtheirus salmonis]|uniref:(salmon louse) hypothetical protein n=1 Tax=Lepeophtheirus salmonis TaxID=72036 RepID=A0A817FAC7_LEPSM|nr:unnamed protein product [Lepeophtheirus salmonis]CAG9475198.1 unnamed protein product [Lepeophtheirus salmonis]
MAYNQIQPYIKDYSRQLFVDCSMEYIIPIAFKVPHNSDPILMIHPDYKSASLTDKPSLNEDIGPIEEKALSQGIKRSFQQMSSNREMNWARVTSHFPSSNNFCCCHYNLMFPKRRRLQDNLKKVPSTKGFLQYDQKITHN